MNPPRTKVKIGGRTLEVTVYRDAKNTSKLADAINARLKTIEAASDRIDTQAFTLEAALAFAAEAQALAEAADADRAETIKELERLNKAIDKLVREFRQGA